MSVASRLGVGRPVRTGANLTPMIDMTFLLVVFFILVSRITSVEQVPLELPAPTKPAANPAPEAPRLVVNVPADEAGDAIGILLDQRSYDFGGPGRVRAPTSSNAYEGQRGVGVGGGGS